HIICYRDWSSDVCSSDLGLLAELHAQSAVLDVRDLFFDLMQGTRYLDGASAQAVANVSRFAELMAEFCETSVDRSLEAYMRRLRSAQRRVGKELTLLWVE